jgi:hypothetical protein
MEGGLYTEAEQQFVHVAGQPFAHDGELTPGGSGPAADFRARRAHRAIGIHQSLEEREPLCDGGMQITLGNMLVPEHPQLTKLSRQRLRFVYRPLTDPAAAPLTLVVVLA